MTARRILVSTYGSAGDLFPLLPIVSALRARGDEVRVATGRSTGLYLRGLGIPAIGLGDGSELRVLDDPQTFTNRFDGWSSWRHVVTRYVGPALPGDLATLEATLRTWSPDLVVTSGFAAAARIGAHRLGIPLVNASIYPQHAALASRGDRFASPFTRRVAELAGLPPRDRLVTRLAWGEPTDLMLHDQALLGPHRPGPEPSGFPDGNAVSGSSVDEERLAEWLSSPGGPTVLVTLGSFIGLSQQDVWHHAADAVKQLGWRAAFVGGRSSWVDPAFAGRADLCRVGFVALPRFVPQVDAVIHHGGIGTTFTTLRAGRPAVVLPQAFDQGFNARLVTRAEAGCDGRSLPLADALAVTQRPAARAGAATVAGSLTCSDHAVAAAVRALDDHAGWR